MGSSDELIARSRPADLAVRWRDFLGPRQTAEELVLHLITETATHAGQLDVVRESIDGTTWLVFD
ncbi:MAG TPA: DUF664 domain-containing protein [Frankiaceae bacterium]|nr:DUF664 domain-containing protein [Frankiaceae bacterium]